MWPNPQETADLITFTEEIFNGKLHFLCTVLNVEDPLDLQITLAFFNFNFLHNYGNKRRKFISLS